MSALDTTKPYHGKILLSILISSLPDRINNLQVLLERIIPQTKEKAVEVLILMDNRMTSVGEKRQKLNEMAKGLYVVHVDDDDMVAHDYVDELLNRIKMNCFDCINFICMVQDDKNKDPKPCFYSKDFEYANTLTAYYRWPNHLCCYRTSVALKHAFNNLPNGEDDDWAKRASKDIKTECIIDRPLYFYNYVPKQEDWYVTNGFLKS